MRIEIKYDDQPPSWAFFCCMIRKQKFGHTTEIQDRIWCFFGNSYMLDWYERTDHMILETAVLQVKSGMSDEFERNFKKASAIISSMKGYISHELQKCIEEDRKYLLLVRWETLEDHTEGFRGSADYLEWKSLLHHFYDPFPTVEHYTNVDLS